MGSILGATKQTMAEKKYEKTDKYFRLSRAFVVEFWKVACKHLHMIKPCHFFGN